MVVACWVDAGPGIGLGHLSRVLAIGEALVARGVAWQPALSPDPTALAWLRAAGVRRPLLLPERGPVLPHVLDAVAGAAAVIADVRRPLTRSEVRALGGSRPVMVIDNPGPGAAEADLVLAPFGPARGRRWLVGPAHVPLRRAFRLAGDLRGPGNEPPRVLISMGAADPGGLTVPAVEGVACARRRATRLSTRVVANPLAPVWERLPALLRRLDLPPPCPLDPDTMPAHLAEADVAVLAMGVTVYEALACGVPAIVACRTAADVAHARELEGRGALVSLGSDWGEEHLASALGELLAAPARRARLAGAGRALVDGQGAERVAARLVALLAREGRDVRDAAHP